MMRIALTAAIVTMMAGVPVTELPAQNTAKQDPNQIICKKQPKEGTRFVDKICHTRAQWDQITEENKRAAAEMANRALPRGCTRPNEC
jgi:hypothetical protein